MVTGRNGSGKSSFAEAARAGPDGRQLAVARPADQQGALGPGLAEPARGRPTEVEVDLVVQVGPAPTTVRMSWDEGQELGEDNWTVQRHTGQQAEKREPVVAGWLPGIDVYRPFLSYGELGALLDKRPTELHEMLHGLLGLGVLDDARDR